MKKDIIIPKVENIFLAVVKEFNPVHRVDDWNVYLINDQTNAIETVLILTKGFKDDLVTSTMRHKIEKLPKGSGAKVEFIPEELFGLNNEYKVTFFSNNTLFEKTFIIKPNTIKENALKEISFLENRKGILIL